jgi:hypothetical protein
MECDDIDRSEKKPRDENKHRDEKEYLYCSICKKRWNVSKITKYPPNYVCPDCAYQQRCEEIKKQIEKGATT